MSKRPEPKFRVGQPVEYDSSDARRWCPAKIKSRSYSEEEGWTYEVSPSDLWCLESEIRSL